MDGSTDKTVVFSPDLFIIPAGVMLDDQLQPVDTKVFGVIYWMERLRDGKCTASNATIGKIAKAASMSVSRSVSRLEKQGHIVVEIDKQRNIRKGITTLYRLVKGGKPNGIGGVNQMDYQDSNNKDSNNNSKQNPEMEAQIADLHAGYVRHYKLEDPDGFAYLSDERKSEVLEEALKKYKLTPKRRAIAAARLKDAGYDMCKQAILRASKDSWTHGDNQRGWFMDLYTYLFKNYEKVEEWATKPEVE